MLDFIIFDLETTGLNPRQHEIIDIGAVRVTPDLKTVRGEFNRKAKPTNIAVADKKSLAVNGYRPELWQDAIDLPQALREFAEFSRGGLPAGFNVSFDWMFLRSACFQYNVELDLDYHIFDIFSVAFHQATLTGSIDSWRLSDFCRQYGVDRSVNAHQALVDAKVTLELFRAIRQKNGLVSTDQ